MKISVFIPTGGRTDSLIRVLESLVIQTYKTFEVIIVVYKPTKEFFSIVKDFDQKLDLVVIEQVGKGLSKAANMAMNKATGDVFVRTDDDVKFSAVWVESINAAFESDPKIGGVTGPTVIPIEYQKNRDLFTWFDKFKNGNLLFRIFGKFYIDYFMEGDPHRVSTWYKCGAFSLGSNFDASTQETFHEVSNLEACNFSVRLNLMRKVGGFDESYTGVGEYHEPDLAFKIKNLGYRLMFSPNVYLNHLPSQDGFYKDRPNAHSRMENFIRFYFCHIKPDTVDKTLRFLLYLVFLNCFYIVLFLQRRQVNQLGSIPATFVGLVKGLLGKYEN